jgi:hypothetical protein
MADGYSGFQRPGSASSDFNAIAFLVQSLMNGMATATLVKVKAVTNSGAVAGSGFVDIQPMVNLVDGIGTAVPHGTIYRCPYMRAQGGTNAIILDPKVGDTGIAVFADRDISSATANKAPSNPGSSRRFDMADGLYLFSIVTDTPTNYVRISDAGIDITSTTEITLSAPTITLTAPTITMNASSGITLNTPTVTASGIVTAAEVDAPIMSVSTTLTVAGKNLGPNHEHDHGTMTASGHTGTVI